MYIITHSFDIHFSDCVYYLAGGRISYASLYIILIKGELNIPVCTGNGGTNYCTENLTKCVSVIMNNALVR